ncbi:probable galactinol--sucrose galactosyltransferase 2 isoform X2 [Durio zibethinus]|nr:probable galactinol--sucrose galactosyltransferase 2 isoform X2 [Durio zibethinus]XP_022716288.1 probable galactinol--sucrose galactosyltransferase 2 isoform X2 [Durio zibethinus]
MIPRVGSSGSDIPLETQMLLLEAKEGPTSGHSTYIIFLPVLDGKFRSSLQGNSSDELEFCVESGDPAIVTSQSLKAIFVNYGNHPFDLVKDSMMILEKQLGTFTLRETKQMPGMLDWFGWCTWDAFYTEVNPQGIKDGLMSLSQGGTPARFLLIDDGWQDTVNEFQKEGEPFVEGSQFGGRLASIKENKKFRRIDNEAKSKAPSDLKEFISDIKRTFDLKYVYVWHALLGYWGGLVPNALETTSYDPKLRYPILSPGYLANMRDISMDSMGKYGIGVIDPDKISQFYDDLHSYLVSQDVDGVKVDAQNILETISAGLYGRMSLARWFQQALERSIATNFKDNSIICCMAQSTDSIYHSKQSAISRASDDYYPEDPTAQAQHVAAVAFNSIFLGEVFVPDWDMFYSLHDAAEFHAVARAVGGCGVYVSDKPGQHDFKILERLVLPDGSVLRAKYPGRPSRDCLFTDPVMDGKSLLKIWNLNKCTGVVGVFNCQGSWPRTKKAVRMAASSELSGQVSPADVEYFEEASGNQWTGDCAVFSFKTGAVSRLPMEGSLNVALKVLECDVFSVSPIKVYDEEIEFAAIGLMNMYNSGGALETVESLGDSSGCKIHVKGRGAGCFGAYSNTKPKSCSINLKDEAFNFNGHDNLLTITIPATVNSWDIAICY